MADADLQGWRFILISIISEELTLFIYESSFFLDYSENSCFSTVLVISLSLEKIVIWIVFIPRYNLQRIFLKLSTTEGSALRIKWAVLVSLFTYMDDIPLPCFRRGFLGCQLLQDRWCFFDNTAYPGHKLGPLGEVLRIDGFDSSSFPYFQTANSVDEPCSRSLILADDGK